MSKMIPSAYIFVVSFLNLMRSVTAGAGLYGPLVELNLGDPCIVESGGHYYAFGTNHYAQNGVNVPGAMSNSSDLRGTWMPLDKSQDLLGNGAGDWVFPGAKAQCGSPDVNQLPDGSWILYYSANPKHQGANHSKNLKHCIGIARSPTGPIATYTPNRNHFICNKGGKGTGFQAPNFYQENGQYYVVYKNGSSFDVANGGVSEIWLQEVGADGETKVNSPKLLTSSTRTGDERGDAEGPALVKNPKTGHYVLFYDGGIFSDDSYHIEYAISDTIDGSYQPQPGHKLLTTGTYQRHNLTAPGAPDFVGNSSVEFTFISQANSDFTGGRRLYAGRLKYNGDEVHLAT